MERLLGTISFGRDGKPLVYEVYTTEEVLPGISGGDKLNFIAKAIIGENPALFPPSIRIRPVTRA